MRSFCPAEKHFEALKAALYPQDQKGIEAAWKKRFEELRKKEAPYIDRPGDPWDGIPGFPPYPKHPKIVCGMDPGTDASKNVRGFYVSGLLGTVIVDDSLKEDQCYVVSHGSTGREIDRLSLVL